jgi:hypothetical protein
MGANGRTRAFPDRPPTVGPASPTSQPNPIDRVPARQVTRALARVAARRAGRPVQG